MRYLKLFGGRETNVYYEERHLYNKYTVLITKDMLNTITHDEKRELKKIVSKLELLAKESLK